MSKFLRNLTKLAVVSSGPTCVVYSAVLYDKYFDAGAEVANATNYIEINNHGVYRYITKAQDKEISIYLGVGVVLLVVLFAMIFLEIWRKSRRD